MTVTDLHGNQHDREELANRADALNARLADQVHQAVRAALNEAQLVAKGRVLDDALDIFDKAQADRRAADDAEKLAKDALDQAEVAARWDISTMQVGTEGNKSFIVDPTTGNKRQVTAAVRDEWVEGQVRQHDAVKKAHTALRKAEQHTAEAKDALERARLAIGIRRSQLEAASIHVQAIAGTLRGER